MDNKTDRYLTEEEIDFVNDASIIETKNRIIKKMMKILTEVQEDMDGYVKSHDFFSGMKIRTGKISKGENFLGLPYLVLDHPAIFKKNNIFAYRTIFWWGHYFSNVLVLRGKYFNFFAPKVLLNLEKKPTNGLLYCVDNHPWNHKMEENYVPIDELETIRLEKLVADAKFLKIGNKTPLDNADRLSEITLNTFRNIQTLME